MVRSAPRARQGRLEGHSFAVSWLSSRRLVSAPQLWGSLVGSLNLPLWPALACPGPEKCRIQVQMEEDQGLGQGAWNGVRQACSVTSLAWDLAFWELGAGAMWELTGKEVPCPVGLCGRPYLHPSRGKGVAKCVPNTPGSLEPEWASLCPLPSLAAASVAVLHCTRRPFPHVELDRGGSEGTIEMSLSQGSWS